MVDGGWMWMDEAWFGKGRRGETRHLIPTNSSNLQKVIPTNHCNRNRQRMVNAQGAWELSLMIWCLDPVLSISMNGVRRIDDVEPRGLDRGARCNPTLLFSSFRCKLSCMSFLLTCYSLNHLTYFFPSFVTCGGKQGEQGRWKMERIWISIRIGHTD